MSKLMLIFALLFFSCNQQNKQDVAIDVPVESVTPDTTLVTDNTATKQNEKLAPYEYGSNTIVTGKTTPAEVISFANTLIGTKYQYGSADPNVGFDCSGFISYVFNHFKIAVPRSSKDFTNVGNAVDVKAALPGDLVLFTGTDSTDREVGHMGIVTENKAGELQFIHSTSGKAYGVTITPLNDYYKSRFVKVIRIFDRQDI